MHRRRLIRFDLRGRVRFRESRIWGLGLRVSGL